MMKSQLKHIVCAISGGVDSCVAAILLKRKGYHVRGVFMRNWDIADEKGFCQADRDKEDAEFICQKIGIPFLEVNFVKDFWNNIFSDFIQDYVNGITPNPDILCNRIIKFDRFFNFALNELQADAVATGHYARVLERPEKSFRLLKGVDANKDQTFFLSQVPRDKLEKCLFPIGHLTKEAVKQIACEEGLDRIANKKESTGICFIGHRKFQNFIEDYIKPKPGTFVNIEDGSVVGEHKGVHCWTIGQRCLIPSMRMAFYVVEKDVKTQKILVAPGGDHSSLYSQSLITGPPYWVTPKLPNLLNNQALQCDFRFQHRKPLVKCLVYNSQLNNLHVLLGTSLKAVTPGQYAVFYKGDECLGSARILSVGPSEFKLRKAHALPQQSVAFNVG